MVLHGLGDRRDGLLAAVEAAQARASASQQEQEGLEEQQQQQQQSEEEARAALRELEQRLDERWSSSADAALLAGLLAARRHRDGLATADAATAWAFLLRVLARAPAPALPTHAIAALLDPAQVCVEPLCVFVQLTKSEQQQPAANLLRNLESRSLLRSIVYLIAAADGSPATGQVCSCSCSIRFSHPFPEQDARSLCSQLAPSLCRVTDALAVQAVSEFLLRLVRERRTLK